MSSRETPSIEDRVQDMFQAAALLSRTLEGFAFEAESEARDSGLLRENSCHGESQDAFRALSELASELYRNVEAVAAALQADPPKHKLACPFVWPAPDVEVGTR